EFGRRHLEPLVLDELLRPIDDEEIAVGVDVADVAGVVPTSGVDAGPRLVRLVEISLHDLGPADQQLPFHPDRQIVAGYRIDDLRLGSRDEAADRTGLPRPRARGAQMRPRTAFGPSVALDQRTAQRLRQL